MVGRHFARKDSMSTMIHDSRVSAADALNALLRAELAAVETYTLALKKFDDEEAIAELQKIRDEHSRAVRQLRDQVIGSGGQPAEFAAGGTFDTSDGKVIGPVTALTTLRYGEETEIGEYEAALENDEVRADCQRMIRTDLLPACRRHVEELNRLLGAMKP
jgi:hypothetical protein